VIGSHRLLVSAAALVALAALSTPAYADDSAWGDGVEVLQDTEMKDLRGGIGIPGIPNINFSIVITTSMNGTPVVTTQLTVDETGALLQQTVGNIGENIANLSPETLAALGLSGLSNAAGVVIDDADGVTALVHNITDGSLQNIIVNAANNRDLAQNIDVTLELPGFEAVQHSFGGTLIGMHLTDDLNPYLD
jgi:hypothetical protein